MNTIVKCGYRPMFPALFNEVIERAATEATDSYYKPAANIYENEAGFNIELALPGFEKEEVSMQIEKDILSISAGHAIKELENEVIFSRKEFGRSGKYMRSFILPDSINAEEISAEYRNGVLKVHLPKKEATPINKKEIVIG